MNNPTAIFEDDGEWFALIVASDGHYIAVKLDTLAFKQLANKNGLVADPSPGLANQNFSFLNNKE